MTTVTPADRRQRASLPWEAGVLTLRRATFRYPSRNGHGPGVHELDLSIRPGEVVGLLGPNGSGKTTTIKLLAGLLLPHSGVVEVAGQVIRPRELWRLRRTVGYAPCGERGLYPRLSAQDNLRLFAALQNLPVRVARRRTATLLAQVGLVEVARKPVNQLSRGMRQRLHLARALLHEPTILLVDEPTLGVDPEAARGVRLLLKSLAAAGSAVLLATNYLPEAAELCSRLTVLSEGRTMFTGPPADLHARSAGRLLTETVVQTDKTDQQVVDALRGVGSATVVRRGSLCLIELTTGATQAPTAARIAELLDAPIAAWHTQRAPTLEDAYTLLIRGRAATGGPP